MTGRPRGPEGPQSDKSAGRPTRGQIEQRTYDQWLKLVKRSVRLNQETDAEAIAKLCVEQNKGTWHAAATFYGNLNVCPCAECLRTRAMEARKR